MIVEAPGIEPALGRNGSTKERQLGAIRHDEDPADVPDRAPKCSNVRGDVTELAEVSYELGDVVEPALARALVLAAEAKRWEVVVRIAEELRRRGSAQTSSAPSERLSFSSNVRRGSMPPRRAVSKMK